MKKSFKISVDNTVITITKIKNKFIYHIWDIKFSDAQNGQINIDNKKNGINYIMSLINNKFNSLERKV